MTGSSSVSIAPASSFKVAESKYFIHRFLGRGGYGSVFVVKRILDSKQFAMKLIPDIQLPKIQAQVEKEYLFLRTLKHPNIVEYVDFEWLHEWHEARIYMEFCELGTLHQHITSERVRIETSRRFVIPSADSEAPPLHISAPQGAEQPERLIWLIVLQLASALAFCHYGIRATDNINEALPNPRQNPICHRDLTPANVFLVPRENTDEIRVKLGDFGLAVDLSAGPAYTWTGTGDYVAPEIAKGNNKVPWTAKCDIYSLGCIIYSLCAGKDPFNLYDISGSTIAADILDEYSDQLKQLVVDCCKKVSDARPNACKIYNVATVAYKKAVEVEIKKSENSIDELRKIYPNAFEMRVAPRRLVQPNIDPSSYS